MSEPVKVKYSCVNPYVEARFLPALLNSVSDASGHAGQVETGGILIGRYLTDGHTVVLEEATEMPKDSQFGPTWFRRGQRGLEALLKDRWARGLHYVGEWHSHPGGSPEPSSDDLAAMHRIASDPLYRCPSPIMLIIGGEPPQRVSISLSVVTMHKYHRLQYGVAMWPRNMRR
ncbi:Mov34/MPN/PAD-1 family protein [Mesorhizobium sp. M0320]|uniref:Mov34/MPN/PAD-1 family protein n=1 Tax=Mesorhizobium sp. M0320 TaxID=2956936 RepID=UPI00333B94CC